MPTPQLPASYSPRIMPPHTDAPWHNLGALVAPQAPALVAHQAPVGASHQEGSEAQAEAHRQRPPAGSLSPLRQQRQRQHLHLQRKLRQYPHQQLPLLKQLLLPPPQHTLLPLHPHMLLPLLQQLQQPPIKPSDPHLLLPQRAPTLPTSSPTTLATTQSRPSHQATNHPSRTRFHRIRTPSHLFRIPSHPSRILSLPRVDTLPKHLPPGLGRCGQSYEIMSLIFGCFGCAHRYF